MSVPRFHGNVLGIGPRDQVVAELKRRAAQQRIAVWAGKGPSLANGKGLYQGYLIYGPSAVNLLANQGIIVDPNCPKERVDKQIGDGFTKKYGNAAPYEDPRWFDVVVNYSTWLRNRTANPDKLDPFMLMGKK